MINNRYYFCAESLQFVWMQYYCQGCQHLSYYGYCKYNEEEQQICYTLMERLETGL